MEVIAKVYEGDRTEIYRECLLIGEIYMRNGVRQRCTGSPRLFMMVVSMIERILKCGMGFEILRI